MVAVLLPLKRFLQRTPQKVCCNFSNIEQILPGAAALGAEGRVFESLRPDRSKIVNNQGFVGFPMSPFFIESPWRDTNRGAKTLSTGARKNPWPAEANQGDVFLSVEEWGEAGFRNSKAIRNPSKN
ncbi:MAG: hypothetical protein PHI97_25265 [Desulfobulbus sp.]|nr:hypothetical protein [Desulfobulbus sp.]